MTIQATQANTNAYQKTSQIENSSTQNKLQSNQANQADKVTADPAIAAKNQVATGEDKILSKDQQRAETQASLIDHLFGDGSQKNSNALRILFQETITSLNEMLAPDFGPDAISAEKLAEQGGMDYWSPENTANRIVQGTVGFFEAYKTANPKLEGEALLDKFMSVIGGGIEEGFKDATSILKGFGVFDGSIKQNAEKTFDLVQQGLQAFREQQMQAMGLSTAKPAETAKSN